MNNSKYISKVFGNVSLMPMPNRSESWSLSKVVEFVKADILILEFSSAIAVITLEQLVWSFVNGLLLQV